MEPQLDSLISDGAEALKAGRFASAMDTFATAVKRFPESLDAKFLFASAATRNNRPDLARRALEEVVRDAPNRVDALIALSHILVNSGEPAKALELARKALESEPGNARAQQNIGRCLLASNEPELAITHFKTACSLEPGLPSLYHDLANSLRAVGRVNEAISALEQGIMALPRDPEGYTLLADLLLSFEKRESAVKLLRRAYELEPHSPRGRTRLAWSLYEEGKLQPAEDSARAALETSPNHPEALSQLGRILQAQGRFDEAETCLREAIKAAPLQLGNYYRVAIGRKMREEDRAFIAEMEKAGQKAGISSADRALLDYALGKAYDDLAEYATAFTHFENANRFELARREASGIRYDPAGREAYAETLKQTFNKEIFSRFEGQGLSSDAPVFIVGMERSGTSLLAQALSCHSQVGVCGEIAYWLKAQDELISLLDSQASISTTSVILEGMADRYLSILNQRAGVLPRLIDKMPGNLLALGTIHLALPAARVLWCLRDPADNCLSAYVAAFTGGPSYLHDRSNLAHAYRLHLDLLRHWQSVLPVTNLKTVRYEELVANPEAELRTAIEFLGLPWEEACLHPESNANPILTPSVWQARQPLFRGSVGRCRNYAERTPEFANFDKSASP
jgi:tetratricopeptide (TPR) repeat protein